MVNALTWSEAVTICRQHSDKLVGVRWDGVDCPFCTLVYLGPCEFRLSDIGYFLHEAWGRQLVGERPFSRRFWMGRHPFYSSRGRYDRLMTLLDDLGVTLDRRVGASGRMLVPPKTAFRAVRRWSGVPGSTRSTGSTGSTGRGGSLEPAGVKT